jgi:hypothetical protein
MSLRVLVAAAVVVGTVSQPRPARADAAEVETLLAKGNQLRREGKPGSALPYFQKAYELARTPRTTGQLGLAELAAGYPVEAAEHLSTALDAPNDPSIKRYEQMLKGALTMARAQVGELAISGSPAGAEVIVNGRPVGTLPLTTTIKLAASNSEVIVRAPGHIERRDHIRIAGGQRYDLTFNLERFARDAEPPKPVAPVVTVAGNTPPPPPVATAHAAAAGNETPSAAQNANQGLRTTAWITGGAAVAALGAGVALNLWAISKRKDFDAACEIDSGMIVPVGTMLTPDQCQDRYDAFSSPRRWSIVGYVSAATLAATSGVFFWMSHSPSSDSPSQAHFTCAPTLNGLSCRTLF